MADGTYRVTQSEDGTRYLHLFPPDKSHYVSIAIGGDDDDDDSIVVLNQAGRGMDLNADTWASVLDELAAAQSSSAGTATNEKGKDDGR